MQLMTVFVCGGGGGWKDLHEQALLKVPLTVLRRNSVISRMPPFGFVF